MGDNLTYVILAFLALGLLALMTQWWFWMILFFVGSLASGIACAAFTIQFAILPALGCAIVAVVCWVVASAIAAANSWGE